MRKKWTRMICGVLTAAMLLTELPMNAFAASDTAIAEAGDRVYGDANGDGVCDYAGSYCVYTDADGDGVCDYCASAHARGHGHGCGYRGGCHRA